jgi:hypothetical protein
LFLARIGTEREDAVRQEHHAHRVAARLPRKFARAVGGEVEPGHDVRNDHDAIAVDVADALLAFGRVRDRKHRVRVRVVDVLVRQDGVQDGLDRRRGRPGAQHVRVELVDHLRIGQLGKARELAHIAERDRRETRRLDGLQVPAAALHVEHVLFLAEEVFLAQLDRGIAAAVEHERAVAAEEAGGVDARPERAGELRRLGVAPEAFHGAIILLSNAEN